MATRERNVSVSLTKTEALALLKVAEDGLAVNKALYRIQFPETAEAAIDRLKDAAKGPGGR